MPSPDQLEPAAKLSSWIGSEKRHYRKPESSLTLSAFRQASGTRNVIFGTRMISIRTAISTRMKGMLAREIAKLLRREMALTTNSVLPTGGVCQIAGSLVRSAGAPAPFRALELTGRD